VKPVYVDEGVPAWFEAESEADRALLAEANAAGWSNLRVLSEARRRGQLSVAEEHVH
jgi:hypothetical protein